MRLAKILPVRMIRTQALALTLALASVPLTSLLAGCSVESSLSPVYSATVAPTPRPTEHRRPQGSPGRPAGELLATLPEEAGGVYFHGIQIVNDSLRAGHPIDDVLRELDKEREDAVSVFRWMERAEIGAMTVEGIDGDTFLKAFADTWHAPAVIRRSTRVLAGTVAWEIAERGGDLTVVYRRANVIYLVFTHDRALLEAILMDMPRPIQ